jgi:hypothetical protein
MSSVGDGVTDCRTSNDDEKTCLSFVCPENCTCVGFAHFCQKKESV